MIILFVSVESLARSHLIFDMMTVSGVPLLFPYKKNPCVLPANKDFRLKVADYKSESLIFVLFLGLGLFCYPLMKNGFWTSYNRTFGTLEHLHKEHVVAQDVLKVEYDFISKGEHKIGTGIVITSGKSKALIFSDNELFEIDENMKINKMTPDHSRGSLRGCTLFTLLKFFPLGFPGEVFNEDAKRKTIVTLVSKGGSVTKVM